MLSSLVDVLYILLFQILLPQNGTLAASKDFQCVGVPTVVSDVHTDVYFQQKLAGKGLITVHYTKKGNDRQQERKQNAKKGCERMQQGICVDSIGTREV